MPRLFRVTERALLTCGRGCLAVRYGLCHGAGRAFRECRKACSGFPNVLRRCSGSVFRGVRNVIMWVWSGVRRFSVICFTKNGCQNILLPVCINIHFRSAAMSARAGFFSRHMAGMSGWQSVQNGCSGGMMTCSGQGVPIYVRALRRAV